MSTSARAVVVDAGGAIPTVQDIDLAELRFDEVLVRVVSAGVCHTDVAWADGVLFDEFPVVLGHECAGVVEAVGADVSRVRPGDRVGIALSHHCGHCRYCESGRPMLCRQRTSEPGRLSRHGEPLIQGFGTGGFAELIIVREASALRLPDFVSFDVAAIVGCATSTGLGAVFNIAKVEYGTAVAILGAGGIGLNVVMGCVVAGAGRIVVADPNPERRRLALEFGATEVIEPNEDAFRAVAADGFSYVFESAGSTEAMELAIRVTEPGGTVTLIGAPAPDAMIRINALDFVPSQRRILGCLTGNVRPNVDFERYFRLFAAGKLPLDRLITGSVAFDNIEEGMRRCRVAEGIRTIVRIAES